MSSASTPVNNHLIFMLALVTNVLCNRCIHGAFDTITVSRHDFVRSERRCPCIPWSQNPRMLSGAQASASSTAYIDITFFEWLRLMDLFKWSMRLLSHLEISFARSMRLSGSEFANSLLKN